MKIGDRVFVHGYIDEIRKDTVIIRNDGGYFGTIPSEVITGELPSAQPKLYGYDIEHLELIANVLRKENLPPERITEVLMDIGWIVAMVRDKFEETLRKAVEQCKI